jgi:histidinol dehydrogenase
MKIIAYPSAAAERRMNKIASRAFDYSKKDLDYVARILNDVRRNGDQALINYTRKFDAPRMTLKALPVEAAEFERAALQVDKPVLRAIQRAARQIESFHRRQKQQSWIQTERPGTLLGQLVSPVGAVGIYVPGGQGGKTPLVSSVLMGAIPAKVAGVGRIVLVTPPTRAGKVNPHLLVAARRAGIKEVYKVGGPWAVAALGFGTDTIPKVDVIVGPGNQYVTLAKKLLFGTVGIDMIAGPSEILVIADSSADPHFVAADLLSQAEHDVMSSAILVTDSVELAKKAVAEVKAQLAELPRNDIASQSLNNYGAIFTTRNIETAADLSNRMAPEHLELQVDDPFELLGSIKNAGAVFLGHYTPEPIGDYIAGPNHVLPTAGTARFSSALSVDHFIKKTSLIHYSEKAFRREAGDVVRLADIEGLGAHARSVKVRLK